MYPQRQLETLAQRKALLQARIAIHRWETQAAAVRLTRPLSLIDRGASFWHNLSPVFKGVGIPLALLLWKNLRRREGKGTATASGALKLATVFETLPLVFRAVGAVRQAARNKRAGPGFSATPARGL